MPEFFISLLFPLGRSSAAILLSSLVAYNDFKITENVSASKAVEKCRNDFLFIKKNKKNKNKTHTQSSAGHEMFLSEVRLHMCTHKIKRRIVQVS